MLEKLDQIFKVYFGHKEVGWEYKIAILLTQIWFLVILNIKKNELTDTSPKLSLQFERIQLMLRFIHENYQENISLDDIASSANISVAECGRTFRKFTAMTPYKYVMDHRLQRSVEYLKTNKYSITEITSLTGFNQVTHFIQVFKRKYGKTPKEYQKN